MDTGLCERAAVIADDRQVWMKSEVCKAVVIHNVELYRDSDEEKIKS